MKVYYKIINDQQVFFSGNVLYTDERTIINPSDEQMVEAGWIEYIAPEPTEEQLLDEAKQNKIFEIEAYDASPEVESFTINGNQMWLGHELRQQIRTSADAYLTLGYTDMTKVFNGTEFTFPITTWIQMLNALEVYAAEALNTTERHINAVNALQTIQEVSEYDYTTNYPEKLSFNTEQV